MTDNIKSLVERLRKHATMDETAAAELDPEHYTPDDPVDIIAGLENDARQKRELADLIEQQAARIAELEADARRYRWIRDCEGGGFIEGIYCRSNGPDDMDAEIDRRIEEYGDKP